VGITFLCYALFQTLINMTRIMSSLYPRCIGREQHDDNYNIWFHHEWVYSASVFIGYCFGCITVDAMINGGEIFWSSNNSYHFLVVIGWVYVIRYVTRYVNKEVEQEVN
jgi:hypothetical protein